MRCSASRGRSCCAAVLRSLGAMLPAAQANDDTPTGDLEGHGGPVKAVAVSPSGSTALSGSFDYSMMQWDVSDPAQTRPGQPLHRS
jgi:WD40 repeat protein